MHPRARELKRLLSLEPHVEGGHYRRIHESSLTTAFGREARPRLASSSIYYLLCAGEFSRWHRIDADEIWNWYEGEPLELLLLDPRDRCVTRHQLGPASEAAAPVWFVPPGCWQAARPLGSHALVGCTVTPGFEWEGFTTLDTQPEIAALLEEIDMCLMALR
ncbi:cupin domain-containing protein [Dokdonella sp.]|uniref:cupin domain-containing protein n=1 Tax=Dokdonella sp. TaxID=2291710 RepID=UPI003C58FFA4